MKKPPKKSPICPSGWKRLLVCTDGSPDSQGAMAATLALARLCSDKIYVVHALRVRAEIEAVAPDIRAQLEREISSHLAAIKASADEAGVSLEIRVRYSQLPHVAILEEAEDIRPDLIIMGRYGQTGLSQLLMGSVTARVIGYSPFNILVIPRQANLAFRRLLVASDGSPCSAAARDEALSLTSEAGSELYAISVAREEGEISLAEEIIHQLVVAANRQGIPLQGLAPQGQQPDDAIIQAALRYRTDLIIMGSHGRTGLKRLLMGSVTERVIGRAPCPVLVVKR
jgi:nucleotide-binding universal stress UspA family protein